MAHHRRSHTSRRETKRIANKKDRAAEHQALAGAHPRQPQHDSWNWRPPIVPVEEYPRLPKKKGKKPPKRHQGCPGRPRKAHQFLTDTRTIKNYRYDWKSRSYKTVVEIEEYRLCVHCPHEEVKNRYGGWHRARRRWW